MVFTTIAIAGLPAGPADAAPDLRVIPGRSPADDGPSAREVARSRERVQEGAERVGRISAELAQANGLLDDLGDQAETAVERYNGERVKLARADTAYQAATRRSAQARSRLADVRSVELVCQADLVPFAPALERAWVPGPQKIELAIRQVLEKH